MKVLFVTHCTDMGGANHSLLQLMKELKANHGIEPLLLAHPLKGVDPNYNIHQKCAEAGIKTIKAKFVPFKVNPKDGLKHWWIKNWIYKIIVLIKLLRYDFDLVHSNSSVIEIGADISRFYRKPHIWHFREFGDLDFGMISIAGRQYEIKTYKRCEAIIAISNVVGNHFRDVVDCSKIHVIYNGIVPKKAEFDAKHNNETIQLCIVGRISKGKNQKLAVQVVKQLLDDGVSGFHLNIIGSAFEAEKSYYNEIIDYVNTNNLKQYITFWGERNDVPVLLSKMDIGLMLSNNEAFGRVTVEYMMQNLCVVASESGANFEIITNGDTGLLFETGNTKKLSAILRILIEDPSLLMKISKSGYQNAKNRFSSIQNSNTIFNLYKNLIKS